MVRASTPLELRNSPSTRGWNKSTIKDKNSLRKSVFKPLASDNEKSHRSPFKFRPLRQSPYKRPLLAPKSKLATIREESPEEISFVQKNIIERPNASLPELDLFENVSNKSANESTSSISDYEGWDDESTLVAKFQDQSTTDLLEGEKVANLAYQLEVPMEARAEYLRHYLAHTIAPAARKVKEVHNVLEQKVDVPFGLSVLSFDDVCKSVEQFSLSNEDDLRKAYNDTQNNVRELFKELKEAYQRREQLWSDLQEAVDKSVDKILSSLDNISLEVDDTVATIDKKAKDVSKSSGMDGKAKQKLLRELLSEM